MFDDTTSEAYRVREQSLAEQPANVARADQRQQDVIARRWPVELARPGSGRSTVSVISAKGPRRL